MLQNCFRYINGICIGICIEYLIRVEFLIYPLIIAIDLGILMLIDIFWSNKPWFKKGTIIIKK